MILDFDNTPIDWESIRTQAAIAIMQSLVATRIELNHPDLLAQDAVIFANELIRQLQDNETV